MRTGRLKIARTFALAVVLLVVGVVPSLAQTSPDDCYPIPPGGCADVGGTDGDVDDGGDTDGEPEVLPTTEAEVDGVGGASADAEVLGVTLARTGSPVVWLMVGGLLVLAIGFLLLARARRTT